MRFKRIGEKDELKESSFFGYRTLEMDYDAPKLRFFHYGIYIPFCKTRFHPDLVWYIYTFISYYKDFK